jgi:hypothetical protein
MQRRTFDYGCLLLRDFSRPLVTQILWHHAEGIEKDLRTLLFDTGSAIKLYVVSDKLKHRQRIDEIVKSYRDDATMRNRLRGFRLIVVPDGFDADQATQRVFIDDYLLNQISRDLLFGIVFGQLSYPDVLAFSQHGGPFGLKYAALDVVTRDGLSHNPTFEKKVGSKGSPLREVLAMLSGVRFVESPGSMIRVPSLKGRFFLDLSRRLLFEQKTLSDWSPELRLIMQQLSLGAPTFPLDVSFEGSKGSVVLKLLFSMHQAKSQFGVDLLQRLDHEDPSFYSDFNWKSFTGNNFPDISADTWLRHDDSLTI